MELRLPGTGSLKDLLGSAVWDALTETGGYVTNQRDNARRHHGVSAEEVAAAVDLLGEGSLEYVGLIGDTAEVQAADVPGGFVFERSLGDGFIAHPDVLSFEQLRAAFIAFHGGDLDAGLTWPATPPSPPEKKRRGFFRK